MRVGTIVSLGASAALGLGALFVARIWLPSQSNAPHAQAAAPGVPVVVAAGPIAYGDKLQPKDLTLVRLPADAAPPGAFTSVDQVLKQDAGGAPVALVAMTMREPVLASKLSGAGARPTLAAMIGEGMRAYTVGVTEVAGGGGHILPGDRVDVVVTRDLSSGLGGDLSKKLVSEVVIQNVRVLGMDLNVDPNSSKPAVAHTATLEVDVVNTEKLALAAQAGTLSLALRRTGSAEVGPVRPIQAADLNPLGAPRPEARPAPRKVAARKPAAAPGSAVVVVHGAASASIPVPAERLVAGV